MKINLLTFRTSLSEGGIQNTGYLLAEQFGEKLKDKFNLITDDKSDIPHNVGYDFVCYKKKWNYIFFIKMIKALNRNKNVDLNLCMHWKCGISAMCHKVLRKKPYAVMVYGNDVVKDYRYNIKGLFYRVIRKIVLKKADVIFACSQYAKELCLNCVSDIDVEVIHPPIKFNENSSIHKYEKSPVIFSIGRIVERKGFQDVVKAMPLIGRKYPNAEYRIAGDGKFKKELLEIIDNNNDLNNIKYLGRITEQQKHEELERCDVFIMPSHADLKNGEVEGFGICYIEANMHGKVAIGLNIGGVTDAIIDGKTGFLLNDSSPETIFEAIDMVLSNHKCFNKQDALEWAKEHDSDIIANRYLEMLKIKLNI